MAFRKNWRTYQARLLARLDFYLEDRRLHIVAAPGSGKTIFGLEVVRRLNQPTLILAHTVKREELKLNAASVKSGRCRKAKKATA